MYCAITNSRRGVNQICVIKNSKELLVNLKAQHFCQIESFKKYDFSTLYTTIPHDKLKYGLFDITDNCFLNKNEKRKY
jgi:hypothetical protein